MPQVDGVVMLVKRFWLMTLSDDTEPGMPSGTPHTPDPMKLRMSFFGTVIAVPLAKMRESTLTVTPLSDTPLGDGLLPLMMKPSTVTLLALIVITAELPSDPRLSAGSAAPGM